MLALQAVADDPDLARAIMEREEPYTPDEVNSAGHELTNSRFVEARAILGV
jgi:hypothetical protein